MSSSKSSRTSSDRQARLLRALWAWGTIMLVGATIATAIAALSGQLTPKLLASLVAAAVLSGVLEHYTKENK